MQKESENHDVRRRAASSTTWQIVVVLSVVLLVAGVLWFKNRSTASENIAGLTPDSVAETGLAPRAGESPEAYFDRMREEEQPIFVFFHAYTCYQCADMEDIIKQVHPAFAEQVALVAVDIYDTANRSLVRRAGINAVPTLLFIDRTGEARGYPGVMAAEQLQERLAALAAGETL